ncbi:MAG TPA: HAMP domain-containing sensor histidine kinase [Kofleriaceae bacterium]|jgi:signal transduction histidine kinase
MAVADGPAQPGAQQAVDDEFEQTARRWERVVGAVRVLVCLIMLARTLLIWDDPTTESGRIRPAALIVEAALYIAASFALSRGGAPIRRLLMLSVALDSVYVFAQFLPNVLSPWRGYLGIVTTPEIAALSIATLAAGLRLFPGIAVFGGVLNTLCFIVLVVLDRTISNLPDPMMRGYQYMTHGTFLASSAALAIVLAVRTRHLVDRAVRSALRAERTRRSLDAILHEHHDVRTLLSAARLNADRLATGPQASAGSLVAELRSDLGDVEALLNAIRARAQGEVLTLGSWHTVDAWKIAREVLDRLRRRFPAAALALRGKGCPAAQVAGGEAMLRRVLLNLVINACEGDGDHGAAHIDVEVRSDAARGRVIIDVIDDGPGFSADTLSAGLGQARSTKVGGSGFGLGVAQAMAQASDGTLTRRNGSGGGAVVSLSLPLARASSARAHDGPS